MRERGREGEVKVPLTVQKRPSHVQMARVRERERRIGEGKVPLAVQKRPSGCPEKV